MSVPIRVKKIRPGDDVSTYCGRCKAERTHQVVALNADGRPATVICRTCGGQHRFREQKEEAANSTRAPRKSARKAEPAGAAPAGPVRAYSPRETYAEGEWVDHPKFGQGRVTQARGGKIEVRFESGPRVLLHAG
jgi:hypothetical protein